MIDTILNSINQLIYVSSEGMVHPGLPAGWVLAVLIGMVLIGLRYLLPSTHKNTFINSRSGLIEFNVFSRLNSWLRDKCASPWLLLFLRIISAAVFLLVIYAGLFGTPVAERNIATMMTWTIWWSGVVISVFFVGSAWCAICPWDALSSWLVRRKLWKRSSSDVSLQKKVPKILRSVWPALIMFTGLSWLELGLGVTTSPYMTAVLALLMVVLATVSLLVYERKAFCRYFCAVGRTIGAYSSLAPIALRPLNNDICASCKTLDCYHGNETVEPCPTGLVMGKITQNTYCTSCGNCVQSCPQKNIGWRFRQVGIEIVNEQRPHTDEAWFILGLLTLTLFHGFTMMPYWEGWVRQLAVMLNDSGQLLVSFTVSMWVFMLIPVALYFLSVVAVKKMGAIDKPVKSIVASLTFSLLPLAFCYHIAHNLTHLVRESHGFWSVVLNPLGTNTLPLSMHELHMRHMYPLISNEWVYIAQGFLVLFGYWIAIRIASNRLQKLKPDNLAAALLPIFIYISVFALVTLWLLMQPMIMRM